MRIAISMWSVNAEIRAGRMDLRGFLRFAREVGAEGVELLDYYFPEGESQIPAIRTALADTPLTLCALSTSTDLLLPDPAARAAQIAKIRWVVDMANTLGAPLIRIFAGDTTEALPFAEAEHRVVGALTEVRAHAARQRVILGIENHGLYAGRADQVQRLISATAAPAVRAVVDTGNFMLVNEDPVTAVRVLAPMAAHVHLKDFRPLAPGETTTGSYPGIDGVRYVGTALGEGRLDLEGALSALQAGGYAGWLSLEYEGRGPVLDAIAASIRRARQALEGLPR